MKHGRKEQFSITIDTELADKFYEYQEKHEIIYKNLAMEQLLKKAFLHMGHMEKCESDQFNLYSAGMSAMMDLVYKYAPKNKTLLKFIKVHYGNLQGEFEQAKSEIDIDNTL